MIQSKAKITAIGVYLPEKVLTNYELEKMVDTSDEWIQKRTGIKERRICGEQEFSSDMAIKAVENLVQKNSVDLNDVDMIIVSTFVPDHMTPSVAALVQGHFKMKDTGAMDLNAACAGFVYALSVANALITIGQSKKVLVIASEAISKAIDYTDRNTCVLFGDGASALLIERSEDESAFIDTYFCTDGLSADKIHCTNLSQRVLNKTIEKKSLIEQDGRAVYKFAVKEVTRGVQELINKSNMSLNDINWFIPHSANKRIIEEMCLRLNFPLEKTLMSIEYFGNTSSASIPLALWLAIEDNKIKKGDILLLYGFGGGLTHGGIIMKW